MTTTTNLPQCWQDVQDILDSGIDRLILFGPPELARPTPDSPLETPPLVLTVSSVTRT